MEGLGVEMHMDTGRVAVSSTKHDATDWAIDAMVSKSTMWTVNGVPWRVTPVVLGYRALGKSNFNMGFAPAIRGLLCGPYKSVRVSNMVEQRLNAQYRADPRKFQFRGEYGPTFAKMLFSADDEASLRQAVQVSRDRGGLPFVPMSASPGAEGRRCLWIPADAAGYREDVALGEQGGGGAWMVWSDATSVDGAPMPVRWFYRPWTLHELMHFSTWLEAANGTQLIPLAAELGAQDIILVLDNQSWVECGRTLSCRSLDMVPQVNALARVVDSLPDVRLFLVFHHREEGPEADAISKAYLVMGSGSGASRGLATASAMLQSRGFAELTAENRIGIDVGPLEMED
jgi:hypothetical protein